MLGEGVLEVQHHIFLISALDGMVSFTIQPLYPQERTAVAVN
jgi:hypothetical protein